MTTARTWNDLLAYIRDRRAQNLHIETVTVGPYFAALKIGHTLQHVQDAISGGSVANDLISHLNKEQMAELFATGFLTIRQQDPAIGTISARIFKTTGAYGVSLTITSTTPPALDPSIPESFIKSLRTPSGIAIVAGPKGSGVSAAHASLLQHLAKDNPEAIIAYIGSPPPYQLEGIRALPIYLDAGPRREFARFSNAIALASEARANIIAMDGGLDTGEGVREALRAARAGALVLATVRAKTAMEVVRNLHTLLPQNERDHWWSTLAEQFISVLALTRLPGRFASQSFQAPEVLVGTPTLFAPILSLDFAAIAMHLSGDREGSRGRDSALDQLCAEGKITGQTAQAYAANPSRFSKVAV